MPRIIVISTCGTKKNAAAIGRDLVRRRLAACVNMLPVDSIFRWKRRTEAQREFLLLIKTRSEVFEKIKQRILSMHRYELPEVVALKIDYGHAHYLRWIDSEVKSHK